MTDLGRLTPKDFWARVEGHELSTIEQIAPHARPGDYVISRSHYAVQLTSPLRLAEERDRPRIVGWTGNVIPYVYDIGDRIGDVWPSTCPVYLIHGHHDPADTYQI